MLYLNKQDIERVIVYEQMIDVIEHAIRVYETGDFVMPDRISVSCDSDTYLYMPCITSEVIGTKILTLYPNNPQFGKDVIQGVMLLNNTNTGEIDCMLDGATLTAYRTGAVGAIGIKYTTPQNATRLGIIGCGAQAYYQILYATHIREIDKVYLYDIVPIKAKELKTRILENIKGVEVIICESSSILVDSSQIIITTTTSCDPVISDDVELLQNKHFIGIGSYKKSMREFPDSLFELIDNVYIDVDFAKEESGDLYVPIQEGILKEENVYTLGKVLDSKSVDTSKTTLYKSVGMAMFDIMIAQYIYKKAIEMNVGQTIQT